MTTNNNSSESGGALAELPSRFIDGPPSGHPAGRLLKRLPALADADDRHLAALERRMPWISDTAGGSHRRRRARWALLLLGFTGTAVAATGARWVWQSAPASVAPTAVRERTAGGSPAHPFPIVAPLVPTEEIDLPAGEKPQRAPHPSVETRAVRRAASPVVSVAPREEAGAAPSSLAQESALLRDALARLRRDHDPVAALGGLDEYRARFPAGQLRDEERRARIETLLVAKRADAALVELDGINLRGEPRDVDLALSRGELRAGAGRCAEARVDFGRVLVARATGAAAERALYGVASCALREADQAAARTALEAYLARFPGGRFAAEVRRARDSLR